MGRQWTFGELAAAGFLEYGDGYRTRKDQLGAEGYPILRVAEVLDGRIIPAFTEFVRPEYREVMRGKVSRTGDVVLTTKGTVGRVAIIPEGVPEFSYSPQVCYFRTSEGSPLESRFLYYWLQSDRFRNQAAGMKGQTDMADYLNLADIGTLRIFPPPRAEQQAITEVLGALDNKVALNERIAETVLLLGKTRLDFETQNSGSIAAVSDVAQLIYGKALPAPERRSGEVPVFGCTGQVGVHDTALTDDAGPVVGRKGANAGHVSWMPRAGWVIDTAFYAKPVHPEITSEVLFFLLGAAGLRTLIADSAVPGVNRNAALRHRMRLPAPERLVSFASQARSLLALREQVLAENRALAELRDTLLPQLVSGKLRVKDAARAVEEVV